MPYTPVRLTPDAEALVSAILKAGTVPKVFTSAPSSIYSTLPVVVAYRFGGTSDDLRLADRASMHLQCFGSSREVAADLAETCRVLLFRAGLTQTPFNGAFVAVYREITSPTEVRDENLPDGVWRFDFDVSLLVRSS